MLVEENGRHLCVMFIWHTCSITFLTYVDIFNSEMKKKEEKIFIHFKKEQKEKDSLKQVQLISN